MKQKYFRVTLLILLLEPTFVGFMYAQEAHDDAMEYPEDLHPEAHQDLPKVPAPSAAAPSSPSAPLTWQDSPRNTKDSDITTINEQQGNWFKKAKLFRKATEEYNRLRKVLLKLQPLEEDYTQQRQAADETLNQFYQEYGFQAGEADQYVENLLVDIKRLEDKSGALDPQEQLLLESLKRKQEEIEAVKKDFNELRRLDSDLSKAVALVAEQINRAQAYDEKAYQYHEEIESTLSDELAQQLLNQITNALDNVGSIEIYLNKEFKLFFQKSLQAVTTYMEQVRSRVLALKESGIALGKKMTELLAKEEAAKREQQERETQALKKEIAQAKRSLFQKTFDFFVAIAQSIKNAFVGIFSYFKSFVVSDKKAQPVPTPPAPSESPALEPAPVQPPIQQSVQPQVQLQPQQPTFSPLQSANPVATAPVGPVTAQQQPGIVPAPAKA